MVQETIQKLATMGQMPDAQEAVLKFRELGRMPDDTDVPDNLDEELFNKYAELFDHIKKLLISKE